MRNRTLTRTRIKTKIDRYRLADLIALKQQVEILLSEKRREETAPNIQAQIFDLIIESGLEPFELGFRLLDGIELKSSAASNHATEEGKRKKSEEKLVTLDASELEKMSTAELIQLLETIKKTEKKNRLKTAQKYRSQIWEIIRKSGLEPNVLGLEVVDGRFRQVPKFRDPATGKTWAGRGKVPTWLRAYEANGRDRSEFLDARAA